jgi:hypothetical protein
MKDCTYCKYADWQRTTTGRLHPSGDGKCSYNYRLPDLPQSMWWLGKEPPKPYGRWITRKQLLDDHCVYFLREMQ